MLLIMVLNKRWRDGFHHVRRQSVKHSVLGLTVEVGSQKARLG